MTKLPSNQGSKNYTSEVLKIRNKAPNNQHARFLEAARASGADVDTDAADRLMGKLATMPPEPKTPKRETVANKADR